MKKIELLAPAGNYDIAIADINAGADAIYLGLNQFGARAFADNFNEDELKAIILIAHSYRVKVHVTFNTLVSNDELDSAKKLIKSLYESNVDALIVQDLGILAFLRKDYPDFEVHASTQIHAMNASALNILKQLGVTRVVLPRETSLARLQSFNDINIEKEVFVHGALCISYSGQCLFSSMRNNRSGNRGACAQSCRMFYYLYKDSELIKEGYLLSPKDLMSINYLDDLKAAGVDCIKIEGRMKSREYAYYTTSLYRKALDYNDFHLSETELLRLKTIFNRDYTKGYLFNNHGAELINEYRPNHIGVEIGKVIAANQDKIKIKLSASLNQHDGIRILQKQDVGFSVNKIYFNDQLVNKGNVGDIIELDNHDFIEPGSKVVKTNSVIINQALKAAANKQRKIGLKATVKVACNSPMEMNIEGTDFCFRGDFIVDKAIKRAISDEDIKKCMMKSGDTIYTFEKLTLINDQESFVAISLLNEFRRKALSAYQDYQINAFKRVNKPYLFEPITLKSTLWHEYSIFVLNEEQYLAVADLNNVDIWTYSKALFMKYKKQRIHLCSSNIYHGDYQQCDMGAEFGALGQCVALDYTMNVYNSESVNFLETFGVNRVCLSPELTIDQLMNFDYLGKVNLEMLAYGRVVLMNSAYCPINQSCNEFDQIHCQKCHLNNYYLKDLKDNNYPLIGDDNCIMKIYDIEQVDYSQKIEALKKHGINIFRIAFSNEKPNEIKEVIQKFHLNDR